MRPTMIDDEGNLDYEQSIHLDAEDLGEGGVRTAYERMEDTLRELGVDPAPMTEVGPLIEGDYSVECLGVSYVVADPDQEDLDTWSMGQFALFDSVNRQLAAAGSETRLYAVNAGNDLQGLFLTAAEAERARKALPRKKDWPYLPTDEPEWFGQPHD